MIPWNPDPAGHCARVERARRAIDRPAVAFILTIALFLGALAGLYVAHVTAHRDADYKVSTARTPIDYGRWNGTPVFGGFHCRPRVIVRGRVPAIAPCARAYTRGGTV